MNLSAKEIRHAANLKERIEGLQRELEHLLGSPEPAAAPGRGHKRHMSAAGRARIIAAAKARWARFWAEKASGKPARKAKRKMSAAGRARIGAAARKRWRAAKAAGRNKL